jgi:hypothetical protein
MQKASLQVQAPLQLVRAMRRDGAALELVADARLVGREPVDVRLALAFERDAAAPVTAAQLAELDRDTDMLKTKVASLVSKKAEAEITAELEAKSAPTEFRVLESATPPPVPASPNRPQILFLALLAAIALGAAVGIGQELSDRTLRSEEEAATLSLPVLATVPRLYGMGASRVLALPAMQGEQG